MTFTLTCPEADPGMGCSHRLSFFSPPFGLPELAINNQLPTLLNTGQSSIESITTHDFPKGTVYYQDNGDPTGRSAAGLVELKNGAMIYIGPGPGIAGPGHSPLTLEDIENILNSIELLDQTEFLDRTTTLN